jgi:hypothetical protein
MVPADARRAPGPAGRDARPGGERDRGPERAGAGQPAGAGRLRDIEEMFGERFAAILAMPEPVLPAAGPADRWAADRQYLRHDAAAALAHFRRRRGESLEALMAMAPSDWQRGGEHPTRGRLSIDMVVALMAWHDDNHLEQLTRALEGRP